MAIQHMDNFSMYGTGGNASAAVTRMKDGIWAVTGNSSLVEDPDPTLTTTVFLPNGYGGLDVDWPRLALSSNQTTVGFAQRIYLTQLPTVNPNTVYNAPFAFADSLNTFLFWVSIGPTGAIYVYKNVTGTKVLVANTSGPVVTANGWYHVEVKLTQTDVAVRVEGVEVINAAHGVTTPQYSLVGYSVRNDINIYSKDVVIWDGSGSNNNNFMGPVIVYSLAPTSDIALNWTPSVGTTGYQILDNIPPVDSTDYISAPYPAMPAAYQCGLSNVPSDVTSVRAVMTVVRAKKSDGGDGQLQVSVVSGASTGNGADRPITTAFTYWRDIFPTDPATGSAWTPSAVDAASMKINRTL